MIVTTLVQLNDGGEVQMYVSQETRILCVPGDPMIRHLFIIAI